MTTGSFFLQKNDAARPYCRQSDSHGDRSDNEWNDNVDDDACLCSCIFVSPKFISYCFATLLG